MAVRKETIRTGKREIWGILLFLYAVLLLLSLVSYRPEDISLVQSPPNRPVVNFIGPVGAWQAYFGFMGFGVAAYLLAPALAAAGLTMVFKREGRLLPRMLGLTGIVLAAAALLESRTPWWRGLTDRLAVGSPGGAVGYLLWDDLLARFLGNGGAAIILVGLLVVCCVVVLEVHPVLLAQGLAGAAALGWRKLGAYLDERRDRRAQIEHEQREIARRRRRLEEVMQAQQKPPADKDVRERPGRPALRPPVIIRAGEEPEPAPRPRDLEPPRPPREKPAPEARASAKPPAGPAAPPSPFTLPSPNLLDAPPPAREREIKGDFQSSADVLKDTLAEFGVKVDVANVQRGPVVTRYELLPAPGVRVERIAALSNNIALAMKAESVRVQAPIPGKGLVGIEVPNPKTTVVYLREILESPAWTQSAAALPLALGKDVGGREIVGDLAEMPHLLIAGATGSGKTVCMNSILAGLLLSRTPEQMRLMLIDPKIVEFSAYNHLPHLVVPVITDAKKVGIGLRWAINEMEKRYKLFANAGVRNITAYNQRPIARQAELFEGAPAAEEDGSEAPPARLAYIVIVVDELADLMLVAQSEIENGIARLAQLSRAVGIHMILATQRPSVNVITGTIKANFPARISFQVAQKVDSRTILDANGADKLLGKGDLLFLPPGSSKLVRAQGTMTSDHEIRAICEYLRGQGQPQYEVAIRDRIENHGPDLPEQEEDELLEAAIEIIRQTRRASTSSLQRRLRIGYTRAARLIDLLEERGVVGPPRGSDPREILIDLDGEIPQNPPAETGEDDAWRP
jgi:S-DNA-T family DNA segregation ATPase FtsK/SpoIIIE